jgi:hypothetical protein
VAVPLGALIVLVIIDGPISDHPENGSLAGSTQEATMMNLQLTDDLRQAIEAAGGSPVYLADPTTHASYVILRAEDFEKMKTESESDDVSSIYPLLADIAPEDWEDLSHYEKRP